MQSDSEDKGGSAEQSKSSQPPMPDSDFYHGKGWNQMGWVHLCRCK